MNNTQMARLAEIVGSHDLGLGVIMGAHQVSTEGEACDRSTGLEKALERWDRQLGIETLLKTR